MATTKKKSVKKKVGAKKNVKKTTTEPKKKAVKKAGIKATKKSTTPQPEKKGINWMNLFLTGVGALIGIILGKVLGIGLISVLIVVAIGFFPGWWLGRWWGKKSSGPKMTSVAVYLNAIAWVIPLIGFFIGGLALGGAQATNLKGKKHLIWIYGGLIISFINAVVGAYMWTQDSFLIKL